MPYTGPGVGYHCDADEDGEPGPLWSRAALGRVARGSAPQACQKRRVDRAADVKQAGPGRLHRRLDEAVEAPLSRDAHEGGGPSYSPPGSTARPQRRP